MKILLIGNYFYDFGGAERVFFATADLLKSHGHEVAFLAMDNKKNFDSKFSRYFIDEVDLSDRSHFFTNLIRGPKQVYNLQTKRNARQLIKDFKPDVAHIHNIGRRITLSVVDVLKEEGVPIVHTLHDYKPVCSINNFFLRGKVCEKCKDGQYYNACLSRCNANSSSASFFDSLEKYFHKWRSTYSHVGKFISPSNFLKKKMEECGFSSKKIVVVPNFIDIEKIKPHYSTGKYFLSFGRLDNGKGLETLIGAFNKLPELSLKIAGKGPLEKELKSLANKNVEFVGYLGTSELNRMVADAKAVIVPSEWFEVFGLVTLESMAGGKVIIGSDCGATHELISEETGAIFKAGDEADLIEKVRDINSMSETKLMNMGQKAREIVEKKYGSDKHYKQLISVYKEVVNGN